MAFDEVKPLVKYYFILFALFQVDNLNRVGRFQLNRWGVLVPLQAVLFIYLLGLVSRMMFDRFDLYAILYNEEEYLYKKWSWFYEGNYKK